MSAKVKRVLTCSFLFQSCLIAGGYGTGAEIAEFFGTSGIVGGLLGIALTAVIWAFVCAITYEFARFFKTYDYGSMMNQLLGKLGWLYDILYYLMMCLVLAIVVASAGSMINALTGVSKWVGTILLAVASIFLVYKGTEMIEKVLSIWSYVLYAVYIIFLIAVFVKFGGNIAAEFSLGEINAGWALSSFKYSMYNLVIAPLVLYTLRDVEDRKEAIWCGVGAAVIGALPGVFLLLTFGADLSACVAAETPITVVFELLDMQWLYILFEIVLFGTLIESAAGFIKAATDRIEVSMQNRGKEVSPYLHVGLATAIMLLGVAVSVFGLKDLIAKGYGTICWGFFFIYALPMVTLGVYKLYKGYKEQAADEAPAE